VHEQDEVSDDSGDFLLDGHTLGQFLVQRITSFLLG
jgi:hypothetical protein